MTTEIPYYGLRAYALFFSKHTTEQEFGQSDLDWIVSESMKKKIFSLLVRAGWIVKTSRDRYRCRSPAEVFKHLLEFRVPQVIREAKRPYAFTGLSAVEIWSDYSYVQRSFERSPYFIKVLKKDLDYWKNFFSKKRIPSYTKKGTTIGEYVILIAVSKLDYKEISSFKVEPLPVTIKYAKENPMYKYAYEYMREKYGK